jgi:hypothetical protein
MGNTAETEQDLAAGLKAAKSKRCYFALVLKGGADGILIVKKSKVPSPEIADAKKKSGGSAVIKGFISYEDGGYVFDCLKMPSSNVARAVKTIVKRDAELTIKVEFRVSTDPELVEPGDQPATTATTKPVSNGQPLPEAAKYAAALHTWEQASGAALTAVEKLVSALRATGDELGEAIAEVIEELQKTFPDTLDDALKGLAQASQAGDAAGASQFQFKAEIAIKAALAYLNNNAKTIDGCENNPFGINVAFRAPLTEALKQVLVNVKK